MEETKPPSPALSLAYSPDFLTGGRRAYEKRARERETAGRESTGNRPTDRLLKEVWLSVLFVYTDRKT